MAILTVYPNKLDRSKRELCPVEAGQTLNEWMFANIEGFYLSQTPPFSYFINGKPQTVGDWSTCVWQPNDLIELVAEPKDPFTIAMAVVAVVSAGVAIYAMSQIPDNFQRTTPEGSPIYSANAQGNQARLMGIIPELFGRHKTFPDIICEPHWYFADDDEFLLLMLAVSVGQVAFTADDIFIADTPISRYGSDIDFRHFQPGEDVSSHPAHQNIYTSREVGATSSTSGIELKAPEVSFQPTKIKFAPSSIQPFLKTDDYGESPHWPVEWDVGEIFELKGSAGAQSLPITDEHCGFFQMGLNVMFRTTVELPFNEHHHRYVTFRDQLVQNNGGWVTTSHTGIISGASGTTIDGKGYYEYYIRDENDESLYERFDDLVSEPLQLHGLDDAFFKVIGMGTNLAKCMRLNPNASTETGSSVAFLQRGDVVTSGVRLTVLNPLPGKPAGPFFACPAAEQTDQVFVDIKFPDGIGYLNDDGGVDSRSLRLMVEWRPEGETEWRQQEFKREGATRDQLGNTIHVNLKQFCRPEVRIYRITGDSSDSREFDRIEFKRLKARLTANTKYDDFTTLAVRIRGSNSLSRSAENKMGVIATRMLSVPDGRGGWTSELHPTRDIAPAMRYIVHDCGLSDLQIGQHELLRLHDVWHPRGDFFDAVFTDDSTLFDVLKMVLAVGYAEPTLNYGQIVPVRDEPRSVFDYTYQPDNMLGKGLERSGKFIDDQEPDGIEVEYFSTETWKPETILCLLPGDMGINPEKVRAFGVTDRNMAWRFGMRVRRKKRYRRFQYNFQTEMDAFNSNYLDYVALADDVPGYALSGRVEGYSFDKGVTTLRLDMPVTFGDGVHHLALRKPNGRTSGPYRCRAGSTPFHVIIDQALDFTVDLSGKMEPPLWLFGEADSWCYPALIDDVTPSGTEKCSVKAVNYDARVYLDDDNFPDADGYPQGV